MDITGIIKIIEKEAKVCNLLRPSRKREYVDARRILYYFLRNFHFLNYQEIGDLCGNRNHATILHSLKYFDFLLKTDFKFRVIYNNVREQTGGRQSEIEELTQQIATLELELLTIKLMQNELQV